MAARRRSTRVGGCDCVHSTDRLMFRWFRRQKTAREQELEFLDRHDRLLELLHDLERRCRKAGRNPPRGLESRWNEAAALQMEMEWVLRNGHFDKGHVCDCKISAWVEDG